MVHALAFSKLPPAIWSGHFGNHEPYTEVAGKMVKTKNIDGLAERPTDRWCYVIAQTRDAEAHWEVIQELYVEQNGLHRVVKKSSPYAKISGRGQPSRGRPRRELLLPRYRLAPPAKGSILPSYQPLWVRLLFSPFRLPSAATKKLGQAFRQLLNRHVRPIWDWVDVSASTNSDFDARKSPLVITGPDGKHWALDETPLWMSKNDTPHRELERYERVAVGFDPFFGAERLSDDYVRACHAFKRRYEVETPSDGSQTQRMALLDLVDTTVLGNEHSQEKYRDALNIREINDQWQKRKKDRARLLRRKEEAAVALVKLLASPFFWLYQQASLDNEGIDPEERSNPLSEQIAVLARCVRFLNDSLAGRALLAQWALDSDKHEDHFINHVVLPRVVPPAYYLKTFRWGSKAIASVLTQFASHRVAIRRGWTAARVTEDILKPLAKLAGVAGEDDWHWFKGGTFDPKHQIKDIGVIGDAVDAELFQLNYLTVDIAKVGHQTQTVETVVITKDNAKFIEAWIDAGEFSDFGGGSKFRNAKDLGFFVLDGINLALAMNAAREKMGTEEAGKAFRDAGIAGLSLATNLTEAYVKTLGLNKNALRQTGSALLVIRSVVAGYYAYNDVQAAQKALREGDTDYAVAMSVAAAAEATSAATFFYMAFAVGSTAGPWVGVIAGLVAAGAYIVATYVKDDSLEEFLKRCEWGSDPYRGFDELPKWAPVPPQLWKSNFGLQQTMLMRLLARVEVRWASHGQAVLGVKLTLCMAVPETTVSVSFFGTLRDGSTVEETFSFSRDDLPERLPGSFPVRPRSTFHDTVHPTSFTALVRFRLTPDSSPESVYFPMMVDGVDEPDEVHSNV